MPTEDRVDLLWRDQTGETQQSTFQLAEISIYGAAVRAERPVHVGTTVSLRYRERTIMGKVKRCARKGPDFILGIEFDEECDWALRQ